tara:strand:- start:6834 stop:7424 length:591 start_codon:yes stop_codon:yes gene_type:complete
MEIYRVAKDEGKDLKKKMEAWYIKRTKNHVSLVQKYCKIAAKEFEEFEELLERLTVHDDSKFEEPEMSPYVFITWKYKCQDDDSLTFEDCNPPEDIDDLMHEATSHHITTNSHHPEFHAPNFSLNKEDRDAVPDKMVDATSMPRLDVAEMVCDWCSVSEERGNTPKSWADMNVNKRWKFTKEQEDLIYEIIDTIWE